MTRTEHSTSAPWVPELAEGGTVFDRVVNQRPEYAAARNAVEDALWTQDAIDPVVLELCRLRIAQLLGATAPLAERTPIAIDAGLDEATVAALREWPTSSRFDARLRACLEYAEQLLVDAQGVSDHQAAQLVSMLGDGGFLVLTYACGFFETNIRAHIVLGTEGEST